MTDVLPPDAQHYVERFIADMLLYEIAPAPLAFLTDATEDDCDFLFWEHMVRSADLGNPARPRPYRPAKWLNHVTAEGWEVEFGPEHAYVVTPTGECYWRFQPAHLGQDTAPTGPVSSVYLVGNRDEDLIRSLDWGRESYVDGAYERSLIELRISDGVPRFLSAMHRLDVPPIEQQFFYTLEGAHPELPDATVLYSDDPGDVSITRLPLPASPSLTASGWLVKPAWCDEPISSPCFVVSASGAILPLHQAGDSDSGDPPRVLTPISTSVHTLEVAAAFLTALEDTMQAWGLELYCD